MYLELYGVMARDKQRKRRDYLFLYVDFFCLNVKNDHWRVAPEKWKFCERQAVKTPEWAPELGRTTRFPPLDSGECPPKVARYRYGCKGSYCLINS